MVDESQNAKHARSSYNSPPDSGRAKRTKLASSSADRFSKAEQTILQAAAELLDIPLERLLATASSSGSLSTKSTTPEELDETESDSSNYDQAVDEVHRDTATGLFALALPDFSQRSKRQPRSDKSNRAGLLDEPVATITQNADIPPEIFEADPGLGSYFDELELSNSEVNNIFYPYTSGIECLPVSMAGSEHPSLSTMGPTLSFALSMGPLAQENVDVWRTNSRSLQSEFPSGSLHDPEQSATVSHRIEDADIQTNVTQQVHEKEREKSPVVKRSGPKKKWRGPFRDSEQRRETGRTRKLGACIRCSMQRIRCLPDPLNGNGSCLTCKQGVRPRLNWLPCLRYKISDAGLLDHAVCPRPSWTRRWKTMELVDIQDWASKRIKTITITQDVSGEFYDLKVREFIPREDDSLERKWKTDGIEQSFKCAPYAIADMKEAGRTLAHFADRTLESSICYYIDEDDKLLRNTYSMAYRYSKFAEREKERRLLRSALRLWCASRMECRSDRICSQETLGMQPQYYGSKCANSGNILLPPVLSAQMEVIVTVMILQPAKKEVLKLLKELIEENQRSSWFTIYLCIFILLHSCALLTAGDNKKARKQGFESRFFRTSIVEGLHNGAKILLAYFHYCNKGSRPFTMDWTSPEQISQAELNAEQVQFMQEMAQEIEKKNAVFQKIRQEGLFEHDYYFLAQLYDLDWKPIHTV